MIMMMVGPPPSEDPKALSSNISTITDFIILTTSPALDAMVQEMWK
jgi:hypothetical protein